MTEIILREGEVVIGEAELAELRKQAGYADLSADAHAAVRRLLEAHDVPSAPFIDDHVGNAIWQRNEARKQAEAATARVKLLERLLRQARVRGWYTMSSELVAEIDAVLPAWDAPIDSQHKPT